MRFSYLYTPILISVGEGITVRDVFLAPYPTLISVGCVLPIHPLP
ncbi:MAG: hypothetical protein RR198_01880 [Oscillospiraceae bacterium]